MLHHKCQHTFSFDPPMIRPHTRIQAWIQKHICILWYTCMYSHTWLESHCLQSQPLYNNTHGRNGLNGLCTKCPGYNNNLVITAHSGGTKGVVVNKLDCTRNQIGIHSQCTQCEIDVYKNENYVRMCVCMHITCTTHTKARMCVCKWVT